MRRPGCANTLTTAPIAVRFMNIEYTMGIV